ncbi:MAG: hypothetical protein M5R40_21225 [Anaerolineae bacterium]|nr:hypothetical protein [Anaerolineae bacterium]
MTAQTRYADHVEEALALEQQARVRRWLGLTLRYTILVIVSLIFIMPFVLAFFGGFKTNREVLGYPPTLVPESWSDPANWQMFITGAVPEGADHLAAQVATCEELNALLAEAGLESDTIQARQFARDNDLPNPLDCPVGARAVAALNLGLLNWVRVFQARRRNLRLARVPGAVLLSVLAVQQRGACDHPRGHADVPRSDGRLRLRAHELPVQESALRVHARNHDDPRRGDADTGLRAHDSDRVGQHVLGAGRARHR